MGITEVLLIALGVSIDALSVSVSGSFCDRTGKVLRNACRAALFFGAFQFLMPLAGFFTAGILVDFVSNFGHFLAFALLCLSAAKWLMTAGRKRVNPDRLNVKPLISLR